MAKRKTADGVTETPSFDESLAELQSIVSDLEDGSLGLEGSLAQFEKGIRLLRTCYAILESAEAKVELLTRFGTANEPAQTTSFEAAGTIETSREQIQEPSVPNVNNSGIPSEADDDHSRLF